MLDKFWCKLLFDWDRAGKKGLTLTYLIGSQEFLPSAMRRLSIAELVEDMAMNEVCKVIVTYCMDLNELIFAIMSDRRKGDPGRFVVDDKGRETSLFINPIAYDLGETISEVYASLAYRYQGYIDQRLYSVHGGQRAYFEDYEIQFVQACFSSLRL